MPLPTKEIKCENLLQGVPKNSYAFSIHHYSFIADYPRLTLRPFTMRGHIE